MFLNEIIKLIIKKHTFYKISNPSTTSPKIVCLPLNFVIFSLVKVIKKFELFK